VRARPPAARLSILYCQGAAQAKIGLGERKIALVDVSLIYDAGIILWFADSPQIQA